MTGSRLLYLTGSVADLADVMLAVRDAGKPRILSVVYLTAATPEGDRSICIEVGQPAPANGPKNGELK